MSDQRNDEALDRRKQVRLKLRPDLEHSVQQYEGSTWHVLKDPAALTYQRFDACNYFLIQLMDGRHTLEDIRVAFEARYRPQRLSLESLEAFCQTLLDGGLIVNDSPTAGVQVFERRRKRLRRELIQKLTNILYIQLPLFDAEPILSRLLPRLGWMFSTWFLLLSAGFMLSALLLVAVNWNAFWSKMPSAQEFFRFNNFLSLWIAVGLVKILHEFGHGLTCKRFGGEAHDMGLLLMCLSPCIYINVSDAWTLPDKWKRIAVSLAGVWVELMIAAAATFLWWYSTPQWTFHNLCQNLMIVCSANTVMFNGNPLMRYDGYYVLADFVEIPNLRARCNQYLKRVVMQHCLGMEVPPEPPMAMLRRIFFVVFAVASFIYGWFVTFGVIMFLGNFLPYKLRILSVLLALGSLASMVGWPTYHFFKGLHQRGWKLPKTEPKRVSITVGVVSVLLLLFFFLPLPVSRVRQKALVQIHPDAAEPVFAIHSGTLERLHVRDGQRVEKGDILAELSSLELEGQLEEARSEHFLRGVRVRTLTWLAEKIKAIDPQEFSRIQAQIAQADGELRNYAKEALLQEKALKALTIRAPRAGAVLNAPRKEEVGKFWEKDQGVPICRVGDPHKLRLLVPVEPADYRLLQEELEERASIPATVRIQGLGARTWRGQVTALPKSEAKEVPAGLTTRCGGPLAAQPGSQPNTFAPLTQHYLVEVDLLDAERDPIWPGTLGQVKIHCRWKSLGWWLWRTICSMFDLGLI